MYRYRDFLCILIFNLIYGFIAVQTIEYFDFYTIAPIFIILLFLNGIIIVSPFRFSRFFAFFSLFVFALFHASQYLYFKAFKQYAQLTTFLTFDVNMMRFADSAIELIDFQVILLIVLPFIYLWLTKIKPKQIATQKSSHFAKLRILVGLILIVFAFGFNNDFQTNLKRSVSEPIQFSDPYVVYSNIPSSNQFVSLFGLTGLFYREFDRSAQMIEIVPELSIYDQITDVLDLNSEHTSNAYSGLFKDKSLLLIQAESLNNLAIDPILTPTLYRLKTEGWFVNGFNSPLLPGSTSDTEFMVNTSLLPANNGINTFTHYYENTLPFTLANAFSNQGYFAMASHNNYGIYYNRTDMMPRLGFTFFDAIGLNAYDNVEDSYVIDHIKWIQYEQEQYFSFWITFNAHQPYSVDKLSPQMLEYYKLVEQRFPDLPQAEKAYYAKNMDLDRGLKELLIDYKNAERLEDLVVVIYGDHFPKGIFVNKENYTEMCSELSLNIENCFDTPLIFWSIDINSQVISKVSSPLDIAPTLLDLFAMPIPSEVMLGKSIFDPQYKGFYFNEYNVIETDEFVYDALRQTILTRDWTKNSESYRLEAEKLYQRLMTAYKIVENDYFNFVKMKDEGK